MPPMLGMILKATTSAGTENLEAIFSETDDAAQPGEGDRHLQP